MNTTPFHFNLAWNAAVYEYIRLGVYNKFFHEDPSRIRISFFGSIPNLPLNGGRLPHKLGDVPIDNFIDHIHGLNERNIGFNFVFNNTLLEEKHLNDPVSNHILKECESPLNHVITANWILKEYVQLHFPLYQRHASCMEGYRNLQGIDALCVDYDVVVLPEDMNPNLEFISRLKSKNKIEIILNSQCIYQCPFRDEHYKLIHEFILDEWEKKPVQLFDHPCKQFVPQKKDWIVNDGDFKADKQFIFASQLSQYLKIGIKRFKFLERISFPDLPLLLDYWKVLTSFIKETDQL